MANSRCTGHLVPVWTRVIRLTARSCAPGAPCLPLTGYTRKADVVLSGFFHDSSEPWREVAGGPGRRVTTMRLFGGVALFCAGLTLETYVTGALNPVRRARLRAEEGNDGKRNPP